MHCDEFSALFSGTLLHMQVGGKPNLVFENTYCKCSLKHSDSRYLEWRSLWLFHLMTCLPTYFLSHSFIHSFSDPVFYLHINSSKAQSIEAQSQILSSQMKYRYAHMCIHLYMHFICVCVCTNICTYFYIWNQCFIPRLYSSNLNRKTLYQKIFFDIL